jgi:hypothetical protein
LYSKHPLIIALAKVCLRRRRTPDGLAGIGTGDGDSIICGLVRAYWSVFWDVEGRNVGRRGFGRRESRLVQLGSSRRGLRGRSLKLEASFLRSELRLGLSKLGARREGTGASVGVFANVGQVSVGGRRMTGRHGIGAESGRLRTETGSVGSRLAAELGKIEIGSGTVSHVHGLEKASLGVVAVEDDAVE